MGDAASEAIPTVQVGAEWLTWRAGGLNRYADGLARALGAAGAPQRWLVAGDEDLAPSPGVSVLACAPAGAPLLRRWRGFGRRWPEASIGARCVATHFALYAFPLRAELRRRPHVVHFHGPWADESRAEGAGRVATALKRRLERSVYRTGDRFITLSRAFAEILVGRYGVDPSRVRVIPGGVNVERFACGVPRVEARRALGWDADRPTVLCVRRLVQRMGLEQLVEAARALHADVPEAVVLVAGKGPLVSRLDELIHAAGLEGVVRPLGFVPDEALPLAYRAADLTVAPSQSLEGFGLVLVESLAAGTPPLVTPVGGMPEVVRDLAPGLVLPGADSGSIGAGLVAALSGRLALPSAERCAAFARERYAWPRVAGLVRGVYDEAIAEHA